MKRLHAPAAVLALASLCLLAAPAGARLPRTALPVHYDLTLEPDFATDTFRGEVRIAVQVQQPTTELVLHAAELAFDEVAVTAAGERQVARVELVPAEETVRLVLARPLPVGPAEIELRYRGVLNDDLRGFYRGTSERGPYAASQMEATDARRAFPGFDEPEHKATFAVTLVVDEGLTAISNSPVVADEPGPGPGQRTVRFATTPRLSTYHLALLVGDFWCLEGASSPVPTRVCGLTGEPETAGYALAESDRIVAWFAEWFGIPHPFAKLDHVGIPDFAAGAMENPGAIIYRESALLVDPDRASVAQQRRISGIVGHEVAHLWFGDLVTMEWWDDIWLNEGFADFAEGKALGALHPEWEVPLKDVAGAAYPLGVDSLVSTRAIRSAAETPEEIEALFDAIAYSKTAAVLRMLEGWLGEERLLAGIRRHLERNAWGNATADDFAAALSEAAEGPAAAVLESFVRRPGVPLVRVDLRCEGAETVVALEQERFFADPAAGTGADAPPWTVPVCLAGEADESSCVLLRQREESFRLPGCREDLFANAGGTGYYLTLYPQQHVARLREAPDTLTAAERLVVLRDESALVRAERRELASWLELVAAWLPTETQPQVAELAIKELVDLGRDVVGDDQRAAWAAWVRELVGPLVVRLGWETRPGEPPATEGLRAAALEALGEQGEDPAVLAAATRLAERSLDDPRAVDPGLAGTVLTLAARQGDLALLRRVEEALRASDDPVQRRRLLEALTQFRRPEVQEPLYALVLSDAVRNQDTGRLLAGLIGRDGGDERAWAMVSGRWEEIAARLPPPARSSLLSRALGATCEPDLRAEIEAFWHERGIVGGPRDLPLALERSARCLRRRELHGPALGEWLAARPGEGSAAPAAPARGGGS